MGQGNVAPNPMVGAVLVAEGRVIGEGFHRKYGQPHAEVNCLRSVQESDRHLIPGSTLYVSLEPCDHFGKTPPCTDLILSHNIAKVVVGTRDPFPQVNGKGMEKLSNAGIEVVYGVMEKECREINCQFFHFHEQKLPYVILKWAQSADGKIAGTGPGRTFISNIYSNRLVHKWRSEVMSIMVGSNTVVLDDPSLTTRHWPGKDPIRIVVDTDDVVDEKKRVLDGSVQTIIFNFSKEEEKKNIRYVKMKKNTEAIPQILHYLAQQNIQSVMVEGGARLLRSFIDMCLWDEARVITNEDLIIGDGLAAPNLRDQELISTEKIGTDRTNSYFRILNKQN
jgi:diaminohydroxyphosphoribosylaminopyrimidine deaminase / 5-amino-6-(5-phosphoribosylamino)uracil reductase